MKESITITCEVHTPEYGADGHNWFHCRISSERWNMIQHLVEVVKKEGLVSVRVYDIVGSVYDEPPMFLLDADIFASRSYDTSELECVDDDFEDLDPRHDAIHLVVTDDSIWWSWATHYTGAHCETEVVYLRDIEEAFNRGE
jgi:hypothetical protein